MSTIATILSPGESLGGYRIIDVLGFGGMAIVYRAEQISLGREVALKVLSPELGEDEVFRERFRREGKNVAALDHAHIVTVHDSGEADGRLYLAMRLVDGATLAVRIRSHLPNAQRVLDILGPIADALDTAHSIGLVHRDVKPQNILLSSRGDVYLADFGVARSRQTDGLTDTGAFVGSCNYAAPEQALGEPATPATDVYSLAVVMFQCFTGEVPYRGDTAPAVLMAHISAPPPVITGPEARGFSAIFARGLAKDPVMRFPSAGEMIEAAAGVIARLTPAEQSAAPLLGIVYERSGSAAVPAGGSPFVGAVAEAEPALGPDMGGHPRWQGEPSAPDSARANPSRADERTTVSPVAPDTGPQTEAQISDPAGSPQRTTEGADTTRPDPAKPTTSLDAPGRTKPPHEARSFADSQLEELKRSLPHESDSGTEPRAAPSLRDPKGETGGLPCIAGSPGAQRAPAGARGAAENAQNAQPRLTVLCPNCGTACESGHRFCAGCGAALEKPLSRPSGAEVRDPTSPAELRLASVLFVDLVGFTTLSESRGADDVGELLGLYFETARTVVDRYAGTIQTLIGDGVMAVWGVPSAHEDDAERAVRAALDIIDAVAAVGEQVGAPGLRARAGVVTGQVAALESPGEGLVVGDRVNTAARVPSAADPGCVLVDDVTREAASLAVAFEDAGEHTFTGRAGRLRLWRAVRVVAGVGGVQREQLLEAPFVGREADLRLLKELFHGGLDRRAARLVAVTGEAGIGKSRLRWEFTKYIDGLAQRFLWHSGRCPPFGDGVAYWPLAEMVRQRLGIAEGASAADASTKLIEGLDRWVGDAKQCEFLVPRLGALLGLVEPGLGRAELFAGWRLFFERLSTHEPVVLVFEDLQWADVGVLDFIEHLLEWSSKSPIFILTLARPEIESRREGWPAVHRGTTLIQLDQLADEAIGELLEELVDGLPLATRERIVRRAEGVPLYATETVRMLVSRGVVHERDGRLVLARELGELDVPASLSSLLAVRLDALAPAERKFVKAMSVFGASFARSTAEALGDVPGADIDNILSMLVRKQVLMIRADPLSPERGQYTFAQGLLRQVAYEMLSRRERKPRHLAAAKHLRRVFANDGEEVAGMIAAHYLEAWRAAAGDADVARLRADTVSALRRAAQRAATVGAPEVAERAYLTARDLAADEAEHTWLTQAAGEKALQAGRLDAAVDLLEAASAAHRAAGRDRDAARIAVDLGKALARMGRLDEAADRITAALQVLARDHEPDPQVAELNALLGRMLMFAGDDRALEPLETALQMARALNLPVVLSETLDAKAILHLFAGRVQPARHLLAAAIENGERHQLTDSLARAHANAGYLALTWDLPDALAHFEAALALHRRRGDRHQEALVVSNLMTTHIFAARWKEAERLGADLLQDGEQRPGADFIHHPLTILYALRGELDAAHASLEQIAAWRQSGNDEVRAAHTAAEISVMLVEGRAEDALEQGWRMLANGIDVLGVSTDAVRQAWPDTLQAALQSRRLERARAVLGLLTKRTPAEIPPYLGAQMLRGRALTAAAEDQDDAIESDLRASIDTFRELGYHYWLAVTQTDLAAWLRSRGRPREAAAPLEEAVGTLQAIAARPALARARSASRAAALRSRGDSSRAG
ncbi:MAG: protein kinase [Solirubrobacteraceae bacterium]